jgi:STIP1 family protein 1
VANAVKKLTKALTLCVGQNKDNTFKNEISTYIYRAKKLLWYLNF